MMKGSRGKKTALSQRESKESFESEAGSSRKTKKSKKEKGRNQPPAHGDVPLDVNCSLEAKQYESLYIERRKFVWLVKPETEDDIIHRPMYTTGFCMSENGHIIFSESGILDEKGATISVRTMDDPTVYKAKIVEKSIKYGFAVLKIDREKSFDYGVFEDPVQIDIGMNVFGISHDIVVTQSGPCSYFISNCAPYSFFIGHVASDCIKKSEIQIYDDEFVDWFKDVDKDTRFFCISGCPRAESSVGGPVFNSRGHVIGMIGVPDSGMLYASVFTDDIQRQIKDILHSK
ncbi:hypothetical protein OROHE_003549 [Orobanche hederae]